MDKLKGVLLSALAGTLGASLLTLLGSRSSFITDIRDQALDLADKARHVKENVFDDIGSLVESRKNRRRKIFTAGALIGLIIGATSAALLTPKTGKQLRKELSHRYRGVAVKTHHIIGYVNRNGYRKPLRSIAKAFNKRKHTITRSKIRSR